MAPGLTADDVHVAHTPPGGWSGAMPRPVLAGVTEVLVEGAPDLRGVWEVAEVEVDGRLDPDHRALGSRQRIEQAGDRLVVTAGRVVHDMRCDGTLEHGVHDVAEADLATEIHVIAAYEDGVHVLRPHGLPIDIEVTRRLDGDDMVWGYGPVFTARCRRVG